MKKKRYGDIVKIITCILLVSIIMTIPVQAKNYKLNQSIYNRLKGSWAENSSGGKNLKFTKTTVKYYDRETGKVVYTSKIMGCKKYKNGYLIKLKNSRNYKYSYFMYKYKYKNLLEYFGSWKLDGKYYSGSSSLEKVKV